LQAQTITNLGSTTGGVAGAATTYTSVSNNPVCWYGSTTCSSGNTVFGWYINLPGGNEQIVFNPVLQLGSFIVNSLIPATFAPLSCTTFNPTGFTYAISPATGGGAPTTFFGDASGKFNNISNQTISGVQLNGTGSVSLVTLGVNSGSPVTGTFLVTQTSSGTGQSIAVNPLGNAQATRLTWKELR
jgi:type IV pilus assembly protein PilY1